MGSPAALRRVGLSGTARAGLDPCGAFQVHLDIGPGEEVETFFVLGTGRNTEHMHELVRTWRDSARVEEAWQQLGVHWDSLLDAITVRTPSKEMDLMLNRWALYQVLSSRSPRSHRLLSVEWRVWVSRPAPGRAGHRRRRL